MGNAKQILLSYRRFSLRTALIVCLFLCIGLAWYASAKRQRDATEHLMSRGAAVYYSDGSSLQSIAGWLPIDYVRSPKSVFAGNSVDDNDLRYLQRFDSLASVSLANSEVTDAGLRHLLLLDDLKQVILTGTNVTDDGVAALRNRFPECVIHR